MKAFLLYLVIYSGMSAAAFSQTNIVSRTVVDGLFIPWEIIYGPDDHIWLTQKNGYVCRLNPDNGQLDTLYYEPLSVIQSEGGMLGMALHPDFPQQPYVYIAYEYISGNDYRQRIIRLAYAGDTLGQSQVILDDIIGAPIHNGCRLFTIGYKLYVTTGDAGAPANGQSMNSLNGKILRINLDGSIPSDNPIPGSPLWSWGHRNPQGLVAHAGRLYSSEHGPSDNDEINIIRKGGNYGWPDVHGYCNEPQEIQFCLDSSVIEPVFAWTPTIAPSGMDYYEAPLFPEWQHSLLLTTLKDNHLYRLQLNATGDTILDVAIIPEVDFGRLRDICIAPDGRVFLSTSNSSSDGSEQVDRVIELRDTTTGIASAAAEAGWLLYPNPAGDYIYISRNGKRTYKSMHYALINILGVRVREGQVSHGAITLSGLMPGLYFLLLDHKQVGKFRKQ